MESALNDAAIFECQRCHRLSPIEAIFVIKKRSDGSLVRCLCFECESKRNASSILLLYIALPVSALLILLINPTSKLGFFYLMIFAGLIISIPLTVLHELTHAMLARVLKFSVYAIHLGIGKVLFSGRNFGIDWTIRLIPSSAVTLISGPEMRRYRLRIFLIHLAGPAFHAFLIGLLLWMKTAVGFSGWFFDLFLWTNICLLTLNLFSHKAQFATGSAGTDGWAMLNVFRLTPEDLQRRCANFYILETVCSIESGKLEAGCEIAEKGLAIYPDNPDLMNALGYAYVNLHRYEKSRQIFSHALNTDEELPIATKAMLLKNIAFADIMLDDPELLPEADSFSEQAYQMLSWEPSITGTRGGVLIYLNQLDEGIKLLKEALKKSLDKRGKATDACLIALGEWNRGKKNESETYIALAKQLDPECYLIEHVKNKMLHKPYPE